MVYKLFTLILSTFLLSCGSTKSELNRIENQTQIKEIYSQAWVAGIRGGGAGINVYVNLNAPFESGLLLEKIHFKTYQATFEKLNELNYIARIDTGQNKLDDLKLESSDETKLVQTESKINLKNNQAILFFRKKDKEYTQTIENVEEREMIAYPSVRKPTE